MDDPIRPESMNILRDSIGEGMVGFGSGNGTSQLGTASRKGRKGYSFDRNSSGKYAHTNSSRRITQSLSFRELGRSDSQTTFSIQRENVDDFSLDQRNDFSRDDGIEDCVDLVSSGSTSPERREGWVMKRSGSSSGFSYRSPTSTDSRDEGKHVGDTNINIDLNRVWAIIRDHSLSQGDSNDWGAVIPPSPSTKDPEQHGISEHRIQQLTKYNALQEAAIQTQQTKIDKIVKLMDDINKVDLGSFVLVNAPRSRVDRGTGGANENESEGGMGLDEENYRVSVSVGKCSSEYLSPEQPTAIHGTEGDVNEITNTEEGGGGLLIDLNASQTGVDETKDVREKVSWKGSVSSVPVLTEGTITDEIDREEILFDTKPSVAIRQINERTGEEVNSGIQMSPMESPEVTAARAGSIWKRIERLCNDLEHHHRDGS